MHDSAFQGDWVHQSRNGRGHVVITLRYLREDAALLRFELVEPGGRLLLTILVDAPKATRAFDAAGREFPFGAATVDRPLAPPIGVRKASENTVMITGSVEGRPVWIIDDYGNGTQHFIIGCDADLFLHANLDRAAGVLTLTEKSSNHETLRIVLRDPVGRVLADDVIVQPAESIEAVAARCGISRDELLASYPAWSRNSPPAGTIISLV